MDAERVDAREAHHTDEALARRFAWLIGVLDKSLERADAIRRESYQKATWTLATATGLIVLLGIVKGESITELMLKRLTNETTTIGTIEKMVVLGSFFLAATYFALLHQVIEVYSPKKILYPFSLRRKEAAPPISMYEDAEKNREFIEASWEYTMEAYIKPKDLQNNREVLWEYIKFYTEHQALILGMDKPLKSSYVLLRFTVLLSIALLFMG